MARLPSPRLLLSGSEIGAILAGLRLLQRALDPNPTVKFDGEEEILTNAGKHVGLTVDQINSLCERINTRGGRI